MILSIFNRKPNPLILLKKAVKRNPYGLQIVLLNKPSLWTICRTGGDIHLKRHSELRYHGDKSLNEAILELVEVLQRPVSRKEIASAGSFESKTRHILAKTDPGQCINIGTEDNPIFVKLEYDWGYWDDGVHVFLAEGYSKSQFGRKKEFCISWPEMYGYVHSLPPGENEGSGWFRPRIASEEWDV